MDIGETAMEASVAIGRAIAAQIDAIGWIIATDMKKTREELKGILQVQEIRQDTRVRVRYVNKTKFPPMGEALWPQLIYRLEMPCPENQYVLRLHTEILEKDDKRVSSATQEFKENLYEESDGQSH